MSDDRRTFDTGISQEVQAEFNRVAGLLENLLAAREGDVKKAMADYSATGVSDDYHAVEVRWKRAGDEVHKIIGTIRAALETNDGTADHALSRARAAVQNAG